MGNDILEGILRLVNTNLLISLIKYITQVTEKCIHNAGVGGSSPPVATTSFFVKSISYAFLRYVAILITSLARDFCGTVTSDLNTVPPTKKVSRPLNSLLYDLNKNLATG